MKYNTLIVDDEVELANATKEYFEAFGITTDAVYSSIEATTWLNENTAELILLDINLSDGSGFKLCKMIRKKYDMPIIFISARLSNDDILLALNIGGDDYITKPYELSILLAKVKARLKRESNIQNIIKIYDLVLDISSRKVFKKNCELELTNKEFLLLAYLIQNKNKVVTKDEILKAVWKDTYLFEGTITVHIRKLRKLIEEDDANPKMIKTLWGVGYMFDGELE